MAKYLWVGRDYSEISPPSIRVDKYCWNTPGNWRVMQVVNGLNTWVATQDVPAGGDDVVIGGEADVTNAIEFAELPGSSGEASGWIPAKCPLLFGGYSGGVGQGTWSHTGPTAVSGNTWTNSLNTLTLSANGYSRQPWFGGGITYTAEPWSVVDYILARDAQYAGISADFYYSNSAGFRDPRQGLVLKVKNFVNVTNHLRVGLDNVSDINIIQTSINWSSIYAKYNPIFVKAYTQSSVVGSPGFVYTTVNINTPRGPRVFIDNGSFKTINYCSDISGATVGDISFVYTPSQQTTLRISQFKLNNSFVETLFAKKVGYVTINGGTAARVFFSQHPYGISRTIFHNLYQQWRGGITADALGEAPATVSCDFNKYATQMDLYGRTSGQPGGDLYLDNTEYLIGMTVGQRSSFGGLNLNDEYERFNHKTGQKGQTVTINKTGGINIPYINISSVREGPIGLEFQRQSWILEFGSSANVDRIDNEGGFIYSGSNLSNFATIKIGECHLSKYGSVDFRLRRSDFDDWRFGGLTANFIIGGIYSDDNTGTIRGSAGMRIIPSALLGGNSQKRSSKYPSSSIPSKTYKPTTSSK
jgi:hypothetical protein